MGESIDQPIRFGDPPAGRELGVRVCEHICLTNAYPSPTLHPEYRETIRIGCDACGGVYVLEAYIN